MASPIEQFQIKPIIPVINFTNSSLFMIGTAAVIVGGLMLATRKRAVVPGRAQSIAEMLHDFVASTLTDALQAGRA
jgi:F-type H+-transporting ATPase subunit a